MIFDFDVAIVGGGPAGTSTALHLVRRERIRPERVLMLEKAKHPRDKPCGGAVSSWGLDALNAIGVPLAVAHVPMRGLRILARSAVGTHVADLGVVVRRAELDCSLWRSACGAGVIGRDGEPLTSLERVPGGWSLATPARTLTARYLAACDGSGSTVRKALGIREAARKGHLYVAETPPSRADESPERGLCDFDLRVADDGIAGYYWDFPTLVEGRPGVNRGIYDANLYPRSSLAGTPTVSSWLGRNVDGTSTATPWCGRSLKDLFARELANRGVDIRRVKVKPYSTRPLVRETRLACRRLAFVGEAAGIDRTTGEGIAQAILTGGLAAKHLARALRTGDASLRSYEVDVAGSRVGRHLRQSAWLAENVYGPRGSRWRGLFAREALARELGARWYSGARLSWTEKAHLGARLALALAFA